MTASELSKKLSSAVEFLQSELAQIRTGRVTPAILDNVRVEAYGGLMTVKEVGTVNILDPQTLQVTPWDKSLLEAIDKAIRNSGLQFNPVIRGDSVVIPIPSLTEERRKEFTRLMSAKVEETKNTIRYIRQEAMKDIETAFNSKEFGEDEKFTKKEDVENLVRDYVEQAEDLGEKKKQDILGL